MPYFMLYCKHIKNYLLFTLANYYFFILLLLIEDNNIKYWI